MDTQIKTGKNRAEKNQEISKVLCILNTDDGGECFYRIRFHITDVKRQNQCGNEKETGKKYRNAETW